MPDSAVVKYLVKLRFEVDGVVEKADLIGAIFGQTEGLFGPEMNLNELQKTWKVGRIEINLESKNDKTWGSILIPMSTDVSTAALIAAAVESVDKVGPCSARVVLDGIEDVRAAKRQQIADRAKDIMKEWSSRTLSEGENVLKDVQESTKRARVVNYGVENLPAGPGVYTADGVYVVEGRADVVLFLRAGIENVVAIEGTSIPQAVIDLSRKKRIIAVLDGDRGGDLIEKELAQVMKVEKVIRAPDGKEVEDLTPIEVHQMLRGELPGRNPREERRERFERRERPERHERRERFERYERAERPSTPKYERYERAKPEEAPPTPAVPAPVADKIKEVFPSINGTLEAMLLDEGLVEKGRMPISELVAKMDGAGASYIIFDGIVTQRLIDAAGRAKVKGIVGHRIGEVKSMPEGLSVGTFRDLQLE
ncbi:MAG: DNA primase [Nitrososphaerota archaeon]|nr:DNA primase [Nitrososphaerota archaeon]MDG6966269.1 DNA primase [Nitrososphaerota archaeon]MDG6977704.1 DNA primase [Nitrososphaerota archaeon]